MKNRFFILFSILALIFNGSLHAQNSPFAIWGGGLDGSTYQQTAIYSEMPYGLIIEAPLDPNGNKLPIQFGWRGGGLSALKILGNGNVGIGTSAPEVPLTVYGKSKFYPARVGPGDARSLTVNNAMSNYTFVSNNYPVILTTGGGDQPMILDVARLGIGTANPGERLSVNGNIRAKEIKVETANWPDYVFDQDYKILGLQELESYIKSNKHLPEMPSAKEVETNGISLGEMNKLLLKKVEELTLHLINQGKEIEALKATLNKP